MPDKKTKGIKPKYSDIDKLEAAIEKYFTEQDEAEKPYTVCGLALSLGFESRQSIYDYASGKNESTKHLSYTIKKAMLQIENYAEEHLYTNHATGAIFALKNRGWSDKKQLEYTKPVIIQREIATGIEIEDDTEG